MASNRSLGLPPVSAELKSISPYLQRAEEVKSQDPVVAYWCAYYAAQQGISVKAKDPTSRDFLFALLGFLEKLKKDISPNDAVDVESVSAAYVEGFALKVFALADNEDRKDAATKSTAKKFLAAANFLEVLKVFPKSELSEANDEKIRYAKWKAADIAKAFREGRKPIPGPAKPQNQEEADMDSVTMRDQPQRLLPPMTPPPRPSSHNEEASHLSDAQLQRAPPGLDLADREFADGELEKTTPDRWSTMATPGTAHVDQFESPLPSLPPSEDQTFGHSGIPHHQGRRKTAWVSGELEPHGLEPEEYEIPESGKTNDTEATGKSVHFAPSAPDSATTASTLSSLPSTADTMSDSAWVSQHNISGLGSNIPPGVDINSLPPGFVPTGLSQPELQHWIPSAPPFPSQPALSSEYIPTHAVPPVPVIPTQPSIPRTSIPQPPPPELELSPLTIAKVQKHCRFAISALDYEDAEQARKELRTALAMLGG